jgi:hypothetical protein
MLPTFRGSTVHQYDHRYASYDPGRGDFVSTADDGRDATFDLPRTDKYVPRDSVVERLHEKGWRREWLIGWRDLCRSTDERTVIASAFPIAGADDTLSLLLPKTEDIRFAAVLLAALNSIPLDYVAQQKVGGIHIRKHVLAQLPIPSPTLVGEAGLAFILPRVIELTYTSNSMATFARDLGYSGPPFHWDIDRRALLKAELDAYFAYLYGLSRDDLRYILDPKEVMGADYPSETFRVLKEREINDPEIEEYRTRRLVLEAWDRFAEDGTFDLARLRDPTRFDAVQRALVETRGQVTILERELQELLARSDASQLPTLFVEGESDVAILTANWQAFYPAEPLPVTILAAGGTAKMNSLAGKGTALRQVLGDRLVFALADNDREGRELVEDGRTRRGGLWRQQTNGIHWCLLSPTEDFGRAMKRFDIPKVSGRSRSRTPSPQRCADRLWRRVPMP